MELQNLWKIKTHQSGVQGHFRKRYIVIEAAIAVNGSSMENRRSRLFIISMMKLAQLPTISLEHWNRLKFMIQTIPCLHTCPRIIWGVPRWFNRQRRQGMRMTHKIWRLDTGRKQVVRMRRISHSNWESKQKWIKLNCWMGIQMLSGLHRWARNKVFTF